MSVTREVALNYKGKLLELDLKTATGTSNGAASVAQNSDGSFTIQKEGNGGVIVNLPYTLYKDKKIQVTVEGKFTEGDTSGFRLYPVPSGVTGGAAVTFGALTLEGYKANWSVSADQHENQKNYVL